MITLHYKDENWKKIPAQLRNSGAFIGANHAHTCPECDKWTTGTGLTLCPNCATRNIVAARKYVQARLKVNPAVKSENLSP